ncbi:AAA family ATPase [Capillimicrobium parvum]|uniref:AAA+ ATPase domain-containing protein n=1 Tax=Capillimicrobium parvum TaxID=2884022 RepID=A0A9E6XVZ8_9ACTN|nr:ATP-binding protein [Capillimicrobium parvum]UGS34792.1 hypothetical protein DSM104329_01174 [Capillimicrobium parvum]
MEPSTLGERLEHRDASRFVGRDRELAFLESLLGDDPEASVVFVHGPGGIGKSTLLRELARRAGRHDRRTWFVDGRRMPPAPGALEAALQGASEDERPLLLFDSWERISAAGAHLRARVLPSLPAQAVVVLAGRAAPDPDWFADGWESIVADIALEPLPADEAGALLGAHGVSPGLSDQILQWAEGSPLALVLAAGAASGDPDWAADGLTDRPELVRALVRRVARTELDGGNLDVAAVAALARTTTRGLLRDVLPDVDADAAEAWLRSLTFVESAGPGVTLHDVARLALRADLRLRSPEREAELRRRIADHLHDRALAGNPWLLVDLAELLDNPTIRWGFGAEASVDLRIDHLRPGDVQALRGPLLRRGKAEWWPPTRDLLQRAPERVVVARDRRDRIAGYTIAVTPDNAPAAAETDAVLGRCLAYARERFEDGNVLIWRDAIDFTTGPEGDIGSPVLSLMNTAAMLRSGLASPRRMMLPIDPENAAAVAFSQATGGVRIHELDVEIAGLRQECHIVDTGPAGVVGGLRAAIYGELGLPAPAPQRAPARGGPQVDAETVRDALRAAHRPLELARSPLATGSTPAERAASVRALLDESVDAAFGASADEQLLARIIRRGYLDAGSSHEAVADEVFLSRATYFRRLRQATARVGAWVLEQRVD